MSIFFGEKKSKFLTKIAVVFFLTANFLVCQNVLAQSGGVTTTAVVSAQIVATVEIYSAKIVSQKDNQFNLSFDFFNKEGVQPGVKYAAQLFKIDLDGKQTLVDEYVYPEVVDLKEEETKKMEISYIAPEYLRGEFSFWLMARNSSGLLLALSYLGNVNLIGSGKFVEIMPETCFLTIEGEAGSKKYTPSQGVSIKPEENLIVSCQTINHLSQDIKATAQFQTFLRTGFGDEVVAGSEALKAVFELKTKQQKEISFYLPKQENPQAYEVKIWLVADNKPISNNVHFRYVVAGRSATAQNIVFDKDSYQKGETAQISFLWAGMADSFPDSRIQTTENLSDNQLRLTIKDKQGKMCSDVFTQQLNSQDNFLNLSVPITNDCENPKIELVIQDKQGVLDEKTFIVNTKAPETDKRQQYKIPVLIGILVIFLLALIVIIKKKKPGNGLFLLSIFGFAFCFNLLFPFPASAVTVSYRQYSITMSLDKGTYAPNEKIAVYGKVEYTTCSNGGAFTFRNDVTINSIKYILLFPTTLSFQGDSVIRTNVKGKAPASNGTYQALFQNYEVIGGVDYWAFDWNVEYKVVGGSCIPLGSLGCSVLSNCCSPADTCSGSKCCITSALVSCTADNQCCGGNCNNQGKCGADVVCVADGLNCPSSPGFCCNGCNAQGKCGVATCKSNGSNCSYPSQCCSGQCNPDGICWNGCYNNNAVCHYNWQCCSGYCTVADGNYGTKRCKNPGFYPCPNKGSYCSYSSPVGQRIYNSNSVLCPSGTLNTCPAPSTYCSSAVLFNSCGTRCPQGTRNISNPEYCDPPVGYISVQSNSGPIKLSLISVANFQSKFVGTMKVFWKGGQPSAAASLVPLTDSEASPVRVKTISGIKAWKRWWPNTPAPAVCLLQGAACNYQDDCCSKSCSSGLCVCKSNTTACIKDVECCTGYCPAASNTCACIPMGSSILCQQNSQCCSGGCRGTVGSPGVCCLLAGASLGSIGQYCSYTYNSSCCSGRCIDATNTCQ